MPKPGEKVRATCNACSTEFDVTLEPKVAEHAGAEGHGHIPAQKVQHCPFCGADERDLEVEEDD